jgi:hypothetical protein
MLSDVIMRYLCAMMGLSVVKNLIIKELAVAKCQKFGLRNARYMLNGKKKCD